MPRPQGAATSCYARRVDEQKAQPAASVATGVGQDAGALAAEADRALAAQAPKSILPATLRGWVVVLALVVGVPSAIASAMAYRTTGSPLIAIMSAPFLVALVAVGRSRMGDAESRSGCILHLLGLAQLSLSFYGALVLIMPSMNVPSWVARALYVISLVLWYRAYTRRRFVFYVVSWWCLALVIPFMIEAELQERRERDAPYAS
jgi:hypothetical protein